MSMKASICLTVSRATPTTIRIDVPPKRNLVPETPKIGMKKLGRIAKIPRKIEAGKVMRLRILEK
jgi:hypothetical protein